MSYLKRTTHCGAVNKDLLNKSITLSGWVNKRRDHGNLIFIDLRDASGLMQCVFNPDISAQAHKQAHTLRPEDVISVQGRVVERSPETVNKELPTGLWELQVDELAVLNKAKTPPFHPEDAGQVDEELRLKYRYLDLRRPIMQQLLRLRSEVIFALRSFLREKNFYEIETPLLTKNTPEGAREFVVPSRLQPGSFYSLPQSPQLYKQLLMASGVDRYFQIARCFRDEDLRADRQPEFTQLDIEMSFIDETDIQNLIEQLLLSVWKKTLDKDLDIPFERLSYDHALSLYGTDSPDLRFGLTITDATPLFKDTELKFLRSVLDKNGSIGLIHVDEYNFSRSDLDNLVEEAQRFGAKGLLWVRFKDGAAESPVAKFLPADFFDQVKKLVPTLTQKSTLFFMAGPYRETWRYLGRLRLLLGTALDLVDPDTFKFVWITDFLLFEYDETEKRLNAVHHPFTAPAEGWEEQESKDMKARAYDIVLNGTELGGGSIRIHQAAVQEKVFALLGLDKMDVKDKFGFLLEAQQLGFPPHGGIAIGLDRLIMLMAQAGSIREVIAFPKTARGYDLLMEAPSQVDSKILKEYGLVLDKKSKN